MLYCMLWSKTQSIAAAHILGNFAGSWARPPRLDLVLVVRLICGERWYLVLKMRVKANVENAMRNLWKSVQSAAKWIASLSSTGRAVTTIYPNDLHCNITHSPNRIASCVFGKVLWTADMHH